MYLTFSRLDFFHYFCSAFHKKRHKITNKNLNYKKIMKNVYVVYSSVKLKDCTLPVVLKVFKNHDDAHIFANEQSDQRKTCCYFEKFQIV